MEFPKTFAAAKRAEKLQWAIGDALLQEIGPPRAGMKQHDAFERCAAELKAAGMPYKPSYLIVLRDIAHRFDADVRTPGLPLSVAQVAGSPKMLDKARERAAVEGKPVTQKFVAETRRAAHHADRKRRGQREMPEPQPRRAPHDTPVSELRHHANVLELSGLVAHAARDARRFVEMIAGRELSPQERDDFVEEIDQLIDVWKVARSAAKNPLSKQLDDFLEGIS